MARLDQVFAAVVDDPCRRVDLSTSPLPLGPVGDVAAARSVARRLLADCGWHRRSDAALATLLVTALGLHAAAATADEVRVSDVADLVHQLLKGELLEELRHSPMQFVGYATAEVEALDVGVRDELLQSLRLALAGADLAEDGPPDPIRPGDKRDR